MLDAAALGPRFPQHVVRDGDVGVTDPLAGYLRPEASVATAVERASALGASVNPYTEVVAVEPRETGIAVVTRAGEQTYDRVLAGTGSVGGRARPRGASARRPPTDRAGLVPRQAPA